MNDLCTVQGRSFHFPPVLMTNSVQFSWMLLGSPLPQFVNERSEPSTQWKLSSWLSILRDSPIHIYDEPADTTWRTKLFSSTLWIEVKLLFIPAQYVCAWSQGIFTAISLKQELFKRSQSGVEHIAVENFKKSWKTPWLENQENHAFGSELFWSSERRFFLNSNFSFRNRQCVGR